MNKVRRKKIEAIQEQLGALKDLIEEIMEEEQEAYDNLPESLQESERGEAMYNAIDALDSAIYSCEEVDEYLGSAIEE